MNIYDYSLEKVDGSKVSLEKYKGRVLLIVNTATQCGFTSQYEGLEKIYEKYKDHGFEIIDLPSNQFLEAPGTNEEIASFCKINYDTKFLTFAKVKVNGEDEHPLYKYLKNQKPNDVDYGGMKEFLDKVKDKFPTESKDINWNFTKFLIDRQGNVVERYAPTVEPEELKEKIEELI